MNTEALTIPNELNTLSAKIGQTRSLVQGAGGNISIKQGDICWVKASGQWLAHALEKPIFLPVSISAYQSDATDSVPDIKQYLLCESNMPPSIETAMHLLMPHTCVAHVHSVNALFWLVQENGEELLNKRLESLSEKWRWIPYVKPGLPLTKSIKATLDECDADILFLANHGVVIGAGSIQQAWEKLNQLETLLEQPSRALSDTTQLTNLPKTEQFERKMPNHSIIHQLATDPTCFKFIQKGAVYPDHVVFLGKFPCVVKKGESFSQVVDGYTKIYNKPPDYVVIEQKGVVLNQQASQSLEEMLWCQAMLLSKLHGHEKIRYLTEDEMNALINWDAEKYRASIQS
ncbi:MAG: class II aldolase/adducin family protein [Gammaproteobacteria bacterium]